MEFLIFIAIVIIFIIVLNIQARQKASSENLKKDLSILSKQLQDLKIHLTDVSPNIAVIDTAAQQQNEKEAAELKAQEEYKQKIAAMEALRLQREAQQKAENVQVQPQVVTTQQVNETIDAPKPRTPLPTPVLKESWTEKFVKNNPDLEKFIGENLISKIGIGILVLAIGFFVKYAIDQNWIGSIGRVAIGVICGGILIGLAHQMRNTYRSFSSVLAGGGLAVLYFTITLAFQQFKIFDQTTAFIIMIVITAFAVALSLLYNKQELAIIALIGGFAAPFLVSTGQGNYKVLLTYLIILNSGLLVMAYFKSWRLLNLLSFIFTALLFGSWLIFLKYDEPAITYTNGFIFATIFYLLFFAINIAHNIKEQKKFIASDFGILLACTSLYFATGLYCLTKMGAQNYRGLFSATMGIFNLVVSYLLLRKQKADTNILYLLISITLTFISITAPIQLHGNYITIFWASEAVLLYWLFIKSKISIIQYSSVIVWVLMLVSLLIDWNQLYFNNGLAIKIIINKGFITTVFAAIATYLLFILRHNEDDNIKAIASKILPNKNVFRICAIVLLFAAGALEINYQFNYYYPAQNFNALYLLLYTILFISIVTLITQKIIILQLRWPAVVIMLVACLVLYFISLPETYFIQSNILTQNKNGIHFIAHWASAVLIGIILYRLIKLIQSNAVQLKNNLSLVTWVLCGMVVIYLSVEIHFICNNIFYNSKNDLENIERVYIKTGLPILWGLCSFAFMWLGMRYKYRMLRIISLSLFTLTLLKLFLFDIQNIPAGGKIAAFFCLGVLLLVVSFMYQRLKKIIIDDEKKVD